MRSYYLPALPVGLVAIALTLAVMPSLGGPAKRVTAGDAEYQMLQQQAVSAMQGLRREIDPHVIAAQFAK